MAEIVVCFTVALASVASILKSTGGCFGIAGDSGGASRACAGSQGASAARRRPSLSVGAHLDDGDAAPCA